MKAPSDQLAYGLTADFLTWTEFYANFPHTMENAKREVAFRNHYGCEHLPEGTKYEQCYQDVTCAIECFVSYYLSLRGIDWEISWHWGQDLLRRNGAVAKDCPQGFNC